jgi:hypothetical protein
MWAQKAGPKKNKKKSKVKRTEESLKVLEELHIDKGYFNVATWNGERYFQVVVDGKSRKVWLQLLRRKSDGVAAFE